jgi:alpha-1,2-mannosyltransferase
MIGPVVRLRVKVAVAVGLLLTAILVSPLGARMLDLQIYRLGGQAVLQGHDLYAVTEPASGLPFTYPVFAALLFVPFALVPLGVAKVAMTLLSLGALGLICRVSMGGRASAWFAIAAMAAHPVLDTLLFGQINLVLVALVLGDVFLARGRWRGVGVGLAAGIKLTPGLFVLYYLVTGQRREARTSVLTALATVAVGFAAQPGPSWAFFTRYMVDPARTGNVMYVGNQSIAATTQRLLRDPTPPTALALTLAALVVIAALAVARRLDRDGHRLAAVCVVAVAALLASPISWTHHWVWVVPVFALLGAWAGRRVGRWALLAVPIAVVWSGPMRFMPYNDQRELHQNLAQQIVTNSYALLALVFLVGAAVVAWRRRYGVADAVGVAAAASLAPRTSTTKRRSPTGAPDEGSASG